MSYAGLTKGLIAIGAAMVAGARRAGLSVALRAELERSQPELLRMLRTLVPAMFPKAYRWVAEMEQIGEFLGSRRRWRRDLRGNRATLRTDRDRVGKGGRVERLIHRDYSVGWTEHIAEFLDDLCVTSSAARADWVSETRLGTFQDFG
jgi:hypothetical protein